MYVILLLFEDQLNPKFKTSGTNMALSNTNGNGYLKNFPMDPSAGMSYLQNQIQQNKLGYCSENHFSVQDFNSPF